MTANRALMDKLGFALKHDGKEWLVIEDGADDRCATITEVVLWQALKVPGYLVTPIAPELDVTKILLNVVPGDDGEGLEIYAKSVDDVVALLTKQGERIEELESRVAAYVAPTDYEFSCYSCAKTWEAATPDADCPKCGTTNRFCAQNPAAPVAPAEPTHLHRADGTLSGMFIEPATSDAASVAADLRNWFDFLPGHAQPTIEQAVRLLETRP